MSSFSLRRALVSAIVAVTMLLASCLAVAPIARADELTELEERVESTARAYDEAVEKVESLDARIAENQEKIAALTEEIESQREATNEAVKSLYIYQQSAPSLVNMVLSSDTISDLFGTVEYLNRYEKYNRDILVQQQQNKQELEEATAQLESDREEAELARQEAEEMLAEAQAARQEAMEKAAAQAAAQAAAEQASYSSNSSYVIGSVSSSDVNWNVSYEEFVSEWTSRINDYLAGSPLEGQGENFAKAAWTYGVDPRWSPAIACIESSKGEACFKPYNAWGWGSSSWSSWEEAIDAHVNGLARLYGSTLTLAAAQKYCPSTYVDWYNKVLTQMNLI